MRTILNITNTLIYTPIKIAAIVILLFTIVQNASAQEKSEMDVTAKGIRIGQAVPDVAFKNLTNYKDLSGKPATTAKMSDFKGKLVILDFWATWCSPCVAMIPRMDSLQKQFDGKVQFISVTYQNAKEILPFLAGLEQQKGQKFILPQEVSSKKLHQLFPHIYLPHYVWINEEGIVSAITGYTEVNEKVIALALKNEFTSTQKKDLNIPYDKTKPLLIDRNGGSGESLIYHSVLTGFVDGLPYGFNTATKDSLQRKFVFTNLPMIELFRTGFSDGKEWFGRNRIQVLVKDTTKIFSNARDKEYVSWLKNGNGFCYELILPLRLNSKKYEIMKKDLDLLFPDYIGSVEKQTKKCLVLIRTSNIDKIASAGGDYQYASNAFGLKMQNHTLIRFIKDLNILIMQKSGYPIVNGTGYTKMVDIEINARLGNVEEMNKALEKYDLKFVLEDREINVLVIRDRIN